MPLNEELKEVSAMRRKANRLHELMEEASKRGSDAEVKRYKTEYDALVRSLKTHQKRLTKEK